MSLLSNAESTYETGNQTNVMERPKGHQQKGEEMTLSMKKVITQKSPMPAEDKIQKQKEIESLETLFHQILEEKGEAETVQIKRSGSGEFDIEGLSNMTLHTFLLKAEALGKNITYTKSLKVKISD
jgi:hypothetical protein